MKFRSAATMYRGCATSWEFDSFQCRALPESCADRPWPGCDQTALRLRIRGSAKVFSVPKLIQAFDEPPEMGVVHRYAISCPDIAPPAVPFRSLFLIAGGIRRRNGCEIVWIVGAGNQPSSILRGGQEWLQQQLASRLYFAAVHHLLGVHRSRAWRRGKGGGSSRHRCRFHGWPRRRGSCCRLA